MKLPAAVSFPILSYLPLCFSFRFCCFKSNNRCFSASRCLRLTVLRCVFRSSCYSFSANWDLVPMPGCRSSLHACRRILLGF